jgi:hypothetical protein
MTSTNPIGATGSAAQYDPMIAVLARNWWALALRGVVGILFGLVALFLPGATMLSLVLLFAATSSSTACSASSAPWGRRGSMNAGASCWWKE